eukprot:m.29414 g.29414  ORF g.29414 m.29414 type:complete len:352 (+) comp12112_c0_seq2:3464-4519(+)
MFWHPRVPSGLRANHSGCTLPYCSHDVMNACPHGTEVLPPSPFRIIHNASSCASASAIDALNQSPRFRCSVGIPSDSVGLGRSRRRVSGGASRRSNPDGRPTRLSGAGRTTPSSPGQTHRSPKLLSIDVAAKYVPARQPIASGACSTPTHSGSAPSDDWHGSPSTLSTSDTFGTFVVSPKINTSPPTTVVTPSSGRNGPPSSRVRLTTWPSRAVHPTYTRGDVAVAMGSRSTGMGVASPDTCASSTDKSSAARTSRQLHTQLCTHDTERQRRRRGRARQPNAPMQEYPVGECECGWLGGWVSECACVCVVFNFSLFDTFTNHHRLLTENTKSCTDSPEPSLPNTYSTLRQQ